MSEVATWPAWDAASGGRESKAITTGRTTWMVHTFTGNGPPLNVTRATQPSVTCRSGRNGATTTRGPMQRRRGLGGTSTLGVNNYSVTVGAGGSGGQSPRQAAASPSSDRSPLPPVAPPCRDKRHQRSGHTGYGSNGFFPSQGPRRRRARIAGRGPERRRNRRVSDQLRTQ